MSERKKDLDITHHNAGWGVRPQHHGKKHYWNKDEWKSLCGHEIIDNINERWKVKFYSINQNNFPKSKTCQKCVWVAKTKQIKIE